jgi:hypothetical protein
MSHDKHIIDNVNKDVEVLRLDGVTDRHEAKQYYLDLASSWEDPNPDPVVETYDGVRVVRDDLLTGSKVRGGDCLISGLNQSTLVYVQPRTGLAGVSLLDVAQRHGKRVKLFMPSSKRISHHQACCIERGAEYEFHRVAAMPNLNSIAKKWASEQEDAYFIPLGLKHELVTAGFVKVASKIPAPEEVWTVVSTGVLHRALQIAWPDTTFHAVAVARNMKDGEVGHDRIISAPEPFQRAIKESEMPPFPSVATYDAKCWRYIPKNSGRDILFWNVGTEPVLKDESIYETVDSYRKWAKDEESTSHGSGTNLEQNPFA